MQSGDRVAIVSPVVATVLFCFCSPFLLAAKPISSTRPTSEPPALILSAEYYVKNRQFDRALDIYRQLIGQEPHVFKYWERATSLALYVEGRSAAHELVQRYLASNPLMGKRTVENLDTFLNSLYGTFTTDRAQALFLQGLVRSERGDCQGASPFFKQALDQDASQLKILAKQFECLMRLENFPQAYENLKASFALNPVSKRLVERLVEMHLYFDATSALQDTLRAYLKYKSGSPRVLVAEAVALARKTDREAAWQSFRKIDTSFAPADIPAIVFWEKAKLLETDTRRKSALAKSQLTSWLKQFLKRSEKIKGFDPYRSQSFREEAGKWLASLEAPVSPTSLRGL